MLRRTDNPLHDFELWSDDQEEKLAKLPDCICCGNKIMDEYGYIINGDWYCEDCVKDMRVYLDY